MPINLSSTPPSPELLNKEAEAFAIAFSESPKRDANKATQIHRFYDKLV